MADNAETKILNNLRTFYAEIQPLGAQWNPPNDDAKIDQIAAKITAGQAALDTLDGRRSQSEDTDNQLKDLVNEIKQTAIGLVRYVKAAGWSANDIEHLSQLNRRMQGHTRPPVVPQPPDDGNTTPKSRRRSRRTQQTIAAEKEGIFTEMLDYIIAKGLKSEEPRYSQTTLTAMRDAARVKITNHAAAIGLEDAAQRALDEIFYLGASSIVKTALSGKSYTYAIFGGKSQLYHNLAKLKFEIPPRLR